MNQMFINIVLDAMSSLNARKIVHTALDIGCGNGNSVQRLRDHGYDAYGTDVEFKPGPYVEELVRNGVLRLINMPGHTRADVQTHNVQYTWPFNNSTCDLIISRAVLEHVANLDEFVAENARIASDNGYSVHYFPSKYSLIEPHIGIPFGGIFVNLSYYKMLCFFGLCKKRYRQNPQAAHDYMKAYTSYRKVASIIHAFEKKGLMLVSKPNHLIMKHYADGKYHLLAKIPLASRLFGIVRSNVLVFQKRAPQVQKNIGASEKCLDARRRMTSSEARR